MSSQVLRTNHSVTIGALDMDTWAADIIDEDGNIYEVKYMFRREWRKDKREGDVLIDINGKRMHNSNPVNLEGYDEEKVVDVAEGCAKNLFKDFIKYKTMWEG